MPKKFQRKRRPLHSESLSELSFSSCTTCRKQFCHVCKSFLNQYSKIKRKLELSVRRSFLVAWEKTTVRNIVTLHTRHVGLPSSPIPIAIVNRIHWRGNDSRAYNLSSDISSLTQSGWDDETIRRRRKKLYSLYRTLNLTLWCFFSLLFISFPSFFDAVLSQSCLIARCSKMPKSFLIIS